MIYNEGFGTLYERMIRKEYLQSIKSRFNLKNVLEVKCGFGIDSSIFNDVILIENRQEYLNGCEQIRKNGSHILKGDYMKLPFKSTSIDLVWSSCLLDDTLSYEVFINQVLELKRVSRRYLLLFVSNDLHPTHAISKMNTEKVWIDIRTLPLLMRKSGLNVIEYGNIDSPPWPSGFCLPSHKKADSRNMESPLLKKLVKIEKKYIPGILKIFLGHQVFVLAENKYVKSSDS